MVRTNSHEEELFLGPGWYPHSTVADLEGGGGGVRGSEPPPSALEINYTDSLARIASYIWLIEHTNHFNTSQPPLHKDSRSAL